MLLGTLEKRFKEMIGGGTWEWGEENFQGLAEVVLRVGWRSGGGGGARHSEGPTVIFEEYCKLNWSSSLGLPTS